MLLSDFHHSGDCVTEVAGVATRCFTNNSCLTFHTNS